MDTFILSTRRGIINGDLRTTTGEDLMEDAQGDLWTGLIKRTMYRFTGLNTDTIRNRFMCETEVLI